jgi:Lysozyme inhibitor LprI
VKPAVSAFKQVLQRKGDAEYKKHAENYALSFGNPWFVASEKFEIVASAVIPKSSESDYLVYKLTFSFSGSALSLEKVAVLETSDESSDRQLNRTYRSLIPILDPVERETLRKEERAWIAQRDSAEGSEAKEKLVQDRIGELSWRQARRIDELEKEQENGTGER